MNISDNSEKDERYKLTYKEEEHIKVDNIESMKKLNLENQESKIEESKIEESKIEGPKIEESKIEESKIEESKIEGPKIEGPKIEDEKETNRQKRITDTETRRKIERMKSPPPNKRRIEADPMVSLLSSLTLNGILNFKNKDEFERYNWNEKCQLEYGITNNQLNLMNSYDIIGIYSYYISKRYFFFQPLSTMKEILKERIEDVSKEKDNEIEREKEEKISFLCGSLLLSLLSLFLFHNSRTKNQEESSLWYSDRWLLKTMIEYYPEIVICYLDEIYLNGFGKELIYYLSRVGYLSLSLQIAKTMNMKGREGEKGGEGEKREEKNFIGSSLFSIIGSGLCRYGALCSLEYIDKDSKEIQENKELLYRKSIKSGNKVLMKEIKSFLSIS
jgi:hypothetical protein